MLMKQSELRFAQGRGRVRNEQQYWKETSPVTVGSTATTDHPPPIFILKRAEILKRTGFLRSLALLGKVQLTDR